MKASRFEHRDLRLPEPSFNSGLTDLIIELDYLRKKPLGGTTHPNVFFQLKHIFHTLESIGSARIEGNNTTIAEYIETKLDDQEVISSEIREIRNIETTMVFIEETVKEFPINKMFITEVHKRVVEGLLPPPQGEGDHLPGQYRNVNLRIAGAAHIPPDHTQIEEYMSELLTFINNEHPTKYDLLKAAVVHHRFVWIHPFGNGNGRTVRLLTYAMLVRMGFNVNIGRILNPTAVFCSNRDDYYNYLSRADEGTDDGLLSWAEYVLKGLKEEIEKIDRLADYEFLKNEILLPALRYSADREFITEMEEKILRKVIDLQLIQASDLEGFFPGKQRSEISRQIKRMIFKKMLAPEKEGKRKYLLRFDNNFLLRGVIKALGDKDFLPLRDEN